MDGRVTIHLVVAVLLNSEGKTRTGVATERVLWAAATAAKARLERTETSIVCDGSYDLW